MASAYTRLKDVFRRTKIIKEANDILESDADTVMPEGGAKSRGDQMAVLAGLAHSLITAPEVGEDLAAAENERSALSPWDQRNLNLMKGDYLRATALPSALIEAQESVNRVCDMAWREARAQSDFSIVLPHLREMIRLTRERAYILGSALGLSPYDALMDEHQPGITSADVTPIFSEYQRFLNEKLPAIEERQRRQPSIILPQRLFPVAQQEILCRQLSEQVGLDYDRAYLSTSLHPACGGTPKDIHLTTRYDEADCVNSIMSLLHETGHGIYEQGLPEAFARQPVGGQAGMGVHESQSLIIENMACSSDAFLTYLSPRLLKTFGGDPLHFLPETLARSLRTVERSHIRVDADEVTYPAHVIHRFRLEKALIAGDLEAADLPSAWNAEMKNILGITPPNDAKGCLQDIHWYCGLYGYFPSYTLGAMAAAQFMATVRTAEPNLDDSLAKGDFSPLVGWLRKNVHSKGSLYGFNDLVRSATGSPLDPKYHQQHIVSLYL